MNQAIYADGVFTPLGPVDLPDQTAVELDLRVCDGSLERESDGFLRTEGALADDTEWDDIMAQVHQCRKLDRSSGEVRCDQQ